MKTKLLNVVKKCTTLKQLQSASKYLYLYSVANGFDSSYIDAVKLWQIRVNEVLGFTLRNIYDYKAFAEHLLLNGSIKEANEFIDIAENELLKIEV